MTIHQIVVEARKLGISYGEYVHRMKSNSGLIKPERAKTEKAESGGWFKSCEICGKSFLADNGKQKYCSVRCGRIASTQKQRLRLKTGGTEHICACCGQKFRGKPKQKYCSRDCTLVAMRAGRGNKRGAYNAESI